MRKNCAFCLCATCSRRQHPDCERAQFIPCRGCQRGAHCMFDCRAYMDRALDEAKQPQRGEQLPN